MHCKRLPGEPDARGHKSSRVKHWQTRPHLSDRRAPDEAGPVSQRAFLRPESIAQALAGLRQAIAARAAALVTAVRSAWHSWPGRILRWVAASIFFGTILVNAVIVPMLNAKMLPSVEQSAATALGRRVEMQGVRWVSPPGALGMGPLVAVDGVSIGPRAAERSEASFTSATVRVRPLSSLLQRRCVLDVDVTGLSATARQAENYSWFGFPDDTEPSARDFFPGLSEDSAPPGDGGAVAAGGGATGGPPGTQYAWPARPPRSSEQAAPAGTLRGGAADGLHADALGLAQTERQQSSAHASPSGRGVAAPAPAATPSNLAAISAGAADGAAHSRPPPIALRRATLTDAELRVYTYRDAQPRVVTGIEGSVELSRDMRSLDAHVSGNAHARDPSTFRCTMPTSPEMRNIRATTTGADSAPILEHPITLEGPTEAARALYKQPTSAKPFDMSLLPEGASGVPSAGLPQAKRAAGTATDRIDTGPQHSSGATMQQSVFDVEPPAARSTSAQAEARGDEPPSGGMEDHAEVRASTDDSVVPPAANATAAGVAQSVDAALSAAPDGGRIAVGITAADMGVPVTCPKVTVSVAGEDLSAPLVDQLLELPMDVYTGRLNGELNIHMTREEHWAHFPGFSGRVDVSDCAFHFWDSPDDFTGADMSLLFEEDRMHVLNGRGAFGAVHMTARGEMGIDPEHGQYNIQVDAPAVEVNALRATLGVRPLPYPVAGAISGHMQCYGALQEPVFSGRIDAVPAATRDGAVALASAPQSDASVALREARAAGEAAALTYDKVAIQSGYAVFTLNTGSGQLIVPASEVHPTHGGTVRTSGFMNLDPAAEHDPAAVQLDFSGVALDARSLAPYIGSAASAEYVSAEVGKVQLVGHMTGAHSAPVVRVKAETQDGQCLVLLTRDRAAARVRLPSLEASASVLTEFPPYEEQKAVLTQEEAIAMREPEYTGGSVTANARRVDVAPLLRVLRADGADAEAAALEAAPGDKAEVSGYLKLQLHQFGDTRDAHFERAYAGAGLNGFAAPGGSGNSAGKEYLGRVEVRGARVNSLHLVGGLEGGVSVAEGRLKVDATSRSAHERLLVDVDLDSIARVAADGGALADAILVEGAAAADGVEEAAAEAPGVDGLRVEDKSGKSSFDLQHGSMRLRAHADVDRKQASLTIKDLSLDDMKLKDLQGHIASFAAQADLGAQTASVVVDAVAPCFQKLLTERLHVEAIAENGSARLQNTELLQAGSSYALDGEYNYGSLGRLVQHLSGGGDVAAALDVGDGAVSTVAAPAGVGAASEAQHADARSAKTADSSAELDAVQPAMAQRSADTADALAAHDDVARHEPASRDPDGAVDIASAPAASGGGAVEAQAPEHAESHGARAVEASAGHAVLQRSDQPPLEPSAAQAVDALQERAASASDAALAEATGGSSACAENQAPTGLSEGGEAQRGSAASVDNEQQTASRPVELERAAEAIDESARQLGPDDAADLSAVAEQPAAVEGVAALQQRDASAAAEPANSEAASEEQGRWWRPGWLRMPTFGRGRAEPNVASDVQAGAADAAPLTEGEPSMSGLPEYAADAIEAAGPAQVESVQPMAPEPPPEPITWWVRLRAKADLQDIVPALRVDAEQAAGLADAASSAAAEAVQPPQRDDGPAPMQKALAFDSQELDMAYQGGAGVKSEAMQEFEGVLRRAGWYAGKPEAQSAIRDAAAPPPPQRLPGVETLTGKLQGEVTARGGEEGASVMEMDLHGHHWRWGPVHMQSLDVRGVLDGDAGLQLEQLQAKAEGATLSVTGNLLSAAQDARIKLNGLPLEVFRPLVQAALPNLQAAPVEAPKAFQPVSQPLAALQRQIKRTADSIVLPHSPLRPAAETSPAPIQGRLHVDGTVSGPVDAPEGELRMRVDNAVLGSLPLSEASARTRFGGDGVAHVDAVVAPAGASGRIEADCRLHVPDGEGLSGTVTIKDGGMLVLSELAGEDVHWVEGRATVRVSASGTLSEPQLAADAQLSRGCVAVAHLKEPLRGVSGRLRLAGDALTVSNLQASCGRAGVIKASGTLPLREADRVIAEGVEEHKVVVTVGNLDVRHPALHGQIDTKVAVGGALDAPAVSGDLRVSRGSLIISSQSAQSFGPAKGPAAAAATAAGPVSHPLDAPDIPTILHRLFPERADGAVDAAAAPAPDNAPTLQDFHVHLGPDLRITSFPFLQLNVAGSLGLRGPAAPEHLEATGDVQLGPGVVNVFATQFAFDRSHDSRVVFAGDPMNPRIDIALTSKESRIDCDAKLQDASRAITITRLSDGSTQTLGGGAGSLVFEQQLKALLLENDGQIAVQSMVMNALSTMLPRIEGSGRFGNAEWRLVGAPAPLYGTEASGIFLGARAEAEMAYGDQLKILLSSQHLADARVSLTYRLARGVRAHVGYTAPSSLVTLMLDVGDKNSGFYYPSDVRAL